MAYAEVVCFDPATIEVFELQDTLPDFLNNEIVNDGSSYLDEDKFEEVLTILSVKKLDMKTVLDTRRLFCSMEETILATWK